MPARELKISGLVLAKTLSGERFLRLHVLCAQNGGLICLWRHSQKMGGSGPDLFDQVALSLESSQHSSSWFIKEYHTEDRHPGLAKRYRTLVLATRFGELVWRNLTHAEFFDATTELCQQSLRAFEDSALPQCVYLKSIYRYAQEEGYAVRQQWLAGLSARETERARRILSRPLAELTPEAETDATQLNEKLERWLRADTDIIVP